MVKYVTPLLLLLVQPGVAAYQPQLKDPVDQIWKDSVIIFRERVIIPANESTVYFQNGKIIFDLEQVDREKTWCALSVWSVAGKGRVIVRSTRFMVRRSSNFSVDTQGRATGYIDLASSAVKNIRCTSNDQELPTIRDFQNAMGNIIELHFPSAEIIGP